MAGRRQKGFVAASGAAFGAALLAGAIALAPAAAQPVPLPTPAPQPKTGTVPPPPASRQEAPPQNRSLIPSWMPSIFGGQKPEAAPPPGTSTAFEPRQRALVDKVSAYLSSVHVMSGDFVQVGADSREAKGQFYIQKPGKVRFEYDPPSPIDIIADGSSVVVRDRKLATQQLFPLSQTPLRYLLQDRIDLLRDTNVTAVYADERYVSIAVEEKHVLIGTSRLLMMFSAKDFGLRQWVVTDPQGYETTIALSNLDLSRRPDPSLFKIDYTDYSR
jgi:outer membrane lipoprotein-sorting protein